MRPLDKRKSRLGKLLLVIGLASALGALLADLTATPASAASSAGHTHGANLAAPVHSPVSVGFALLGPAFVLAGLILSFPGPRSIRWAGLVAGLSLLYVDGLLHWLAVLEHLGEPLSAVFFGVAGAIQVGIVPLVLRRERLLWWIGVALTVFFIELYVITRIIPPPFSLEPESVESLGTISKGVELALLMALGVFFGSRMVPARLKNALLHGPSLTLLFLGVVASLITINLEAYWYQLLLPGTAFVFTALLLISLIAFATFAYYLPTGLSVALTWSTAAMVIIVHSLYAVNYASTALTFPFSLCLVSGGLLVVSMLTYGGGNTKVSKFFSLRVKLRPFIGNRKVSPLRVLDQEGESEGTL